MSSTASHIGPATAPAHMMCVPLTVFRLHEARNLDLYIWQEADVALTGTDLQRLAERGHRSLYVTRNAYADLNEQLNQALGSILSDPSVAVEERLSVLQTSLALEVDSTFQLISCDRAVAVSQR